MNINFRCLIFPNISSILKIQDPKHAKKTACNVMMSGVWVLTFGKSTVCFKQFLKLADFPTSVMFKHDVIKLNRQDDGAAYRVFVFVI